MKLFKNYNGGKNNKSRGKKGIALFIAVIAVSAISLIVASIADIAFKEQIISYSGKDSKVAFFAADAGLECALYHDVKKLGFFFALNNSSPQQGDLVCNPDGDVITPMVGVRPTPTAATTTFAFDLEWPGGSGGKSCAIVIVSKILVGPDIKTKIESRGYNNTCGENSVDPGQRNIERALEVTYPEL